MFLSTLAIPAVIILTLIFILSTATSRPKRSKDDRKLPPGPPALPVIGNLHMLGELPHRTLLSLATKYGPIMYLRLGQVPAIVISSPEAAELFLKTHDTVFASRPKLQSSEIFSYGSKGLVFSEYGAYWRNIRKLCTLHLLSASKVESFAPLRREELGLVVKSLQKAAAVGEIVDLSQVVQNLIENMVYKMILGCNKDDQFDLKGLVQEGMRLSGAFNLADYVPWLGGFDLQGLKRAIKKTSKAFDEILEKMIGEHDESFNTLGGGHHKDFIDILLSLMYQPADSYDGQNHGIDRTKIKAIALDMIGGALETSASVIVWALSELLRHPRVMRTLQDELETVVGLNRLVEESDLAKLSYLEMVIKETMRLYPAGSLVPRESTEDAVVDGYYIKKKTRVIINLWAIGRDPKAWADAEVFNPERFINKNMDFRGLDFEFIPFGSGRRGCPGIHLGLITVKLVLAQLVHSFSWELPWGLTPNDMDMTEKFSLSLPRAKNLHAVPTYRIHSPECREKSH